MQRLKNNIKNCGLLFIFIFLTIIPTYAEQLQASWYSVESLKKEGTYKYSKGVMANGNYFRDDGFTCATRAYNLGESLRVTNLLNNKTVVVVVTDRIGKRFAKTRIDLSKKAFSQIADLKQGLVPVKVEEVRQNDTRNPALRRSHKDIRAASRLQSKTTH